MTHHRPRPRLTPILASLALAGCASVSSMMTVFDPAPEDTSNRDWNRPAPAVQRAPAPIAQPAVLPAAPASQATPAPSAPRQALADTTDADVLARFDSWQAAWAGRDVEAYLAHYAPTFKGKTGSPAQWRAQRKQIIQQAGKIDLVCGTPKLERVSAEEVRLSFEQHYRSRQREDNGQKTLTLRRLEGRWLIAEESFKAGK